MPYDLRIIRTTDFVRLDAEGHFDQVATRRFFSDAIWACVRSHIHCVLLDVREAVSDMTVTQLGGLANVCRDISPPGREHKIAILTNPELQFARASGLVATADGYGWNIAAFDNFEKAFDWLIG